MKIPDTNLNQPAVNDPILQRAHAAANQRLGQKPGARPDAAGGDEANLSPLSQSLNALGPGSPERQQKIAGLTAAVQSGNYQVDPQAVAASLIEDASQREP